MSTKSTTGAATAFALVSAFFAFVVLAFLAALTAGHPANDWAAADIYLWPSIIHLATVFIVLLVGRRVTRGETPGLASIAALAVGLAATFVSALALFGPMGMGDLVVFGAPSAAFIICCLVLLVQAVERLWASETE